MARGDKSSYSSKQKKQAEDIEKGYEKRGTPIKEAKKRAWATVNKMWGGAQKSTGVDAPPNREPAKKGGKLGGKAAAKPSSAKRQASAKKTANTRKSRQSTGTRKARKAA